MREKRAQMIRILERYPQQKHNARLLQFEISHRAMMTPNCVIESMALSPGRFGLQRGAGHISDQTMMIALEYENQIQQLDDELVSQLMEEYTQLQADLEKVDYYVNMLPEKEGQIIRLHYFEGGTWPELQSKLGLAKTALIAKRNAAVDKLAEMYDYIDSILKE